MTVEQPKSPAADQTPGVVTRTTRVPLSVPRAKLAVPPITGFHTHWFLNKPERIAQALAAGYQFVAKGDVPVPNHSLGGDRGQADGTDLGSQISVIAGGDESSGGQPARLVLMKIRQEWRDDDVKAREAQNDRLVEALRGGEARGPNMPAGLDTSHRIAGRSNRNIFTKRT